MARLLNARLEDIVDETAMQFLSGCGDALGSTKHVANVAKRVEDLYERLSDTLTECTERQLHLAGRVLHFRGASHVPGPYFHDNFHAYRYKRVMQGH